YEVNTLKVAKQLLERVVEVYNDERPHMSLGNLTPSRVHEGVAKGEKFKLILGRYS
ncbi:integrase core domain-containing protein, partial [Ekhidna sp.]